MDIDTTKLESLLQGKNFEEAKKIIADYFKQTMTSEQRASLQLDLATLYLQVMNKINGRYIDTLKKAVGDLDEIDKAEKKSKDTLNLAEVRSSL